jgi:translation initiation factor 1
LDQKRLLKAFKKVSFHSHINAHLSKVFACNGTIVDDEEMGEVIQLQGDHRTKVQQFLIEEKIAGKDQIKVHGF